MNRVQLHKKALKALQRIPSQRRVHILAALERLEHSSDPTQEAQVRAMQGQWQGNWRMRVGSYRIVFTLEAQKENPQRWDIFVSVIGPRGDIYK